MLSSVLKEVRKLNGYTQKAVADYLGVDRSTYTFYETGTTNPSVSTLQRLSVLYDLTLDQLIHGDFDKSHSVMKLSRPMEIVVVRDESEVTLINDYRNLDEDGKAQVMELLKSLNEKKQHEF